MKYCESQLIRTENNVVHFLSGRRFCQNQLGTYSKKKNSLHTNISGRIHDLFKLLYCMDIERNKF